MKKQRKLQKIGDSTADAMSVGKSLEKDSISTTFGMSRVSLCIGIIALLLIIVLPLIHIFGKVHSSSYYYAPHITGWSNGSQKWAT